MTTTATIYRHDLLIAPQDSSHATQITLSQILDVYLALSHNEHPESVEPLYCHLSSRVSLASQHAYLLSAAEQGKTFAEIAAEHLHSNEDSLDAGEDEQEWNDGDEENQENLGQVQNAENVEHTNTGTADSDLETAQRQRHSHTDEEVVPDDVFANRVVSNSEALENRPETDGGGLSGDEENETSATSTVRGDEQEPQGEYDPLSDICSTHCLCYCLDCNANMYADFETSHEDHAETATAAYAPGIYSEDTVEVAGPNDKAAEEEEGKVETQSVVGDTESSRTIEAGDDAFDPTLNADADAEGQSLTFNNEDLHGHVDTEHPADAVDGPDDSDEFDHFSAESVEVDDLNRNSQGFPQVSQSAQNSANTTATGDHDAELDHNDLLDDHDAHEGHDFLGEATVLEPVNDTGGDDTTAQAGGHEDLSKAHRSNEIAEKAEDARAAVQEYDNLVLEHGDTNATVREVTPPVTPSRSRTSKRKGRDDEDEFDLLESGTPDVKRRRPS